MTARVPSQAANLLERWPGYNEQSWSQRFAELDRQHSAFIANVPDMLAKTAATARKQALEEMREQAAEVAETVIFGVRPSSLAEAEGRADARALIASSIRAIGSQNDG